MEPDNAGRYTVYYTPVEVGLYTIVVKWNGKEIEGTLVLYIVIHRLRKKCTSKQTTRKSKTNTEAILISQIIKLSIVFDKKNSVV